MKNSTKLREWRLEHELTIDEVADLTGLSKAYISRLETGHRVAPPMTKVLIARRLGASIRDIFEIEPIEEPKDPDAPELLTNVYRPVRSVGGTR